MDKVILNTDIDGLDKAVGDILSEYTDDINNLVSKSLDKAINWACKELRQISPDSNSKRPKKYKKGWRVETVANTVTYKRKRVRNANEPHLTHLLEYGHLIYNQHGPALRKLDRAARTTPQPHIEKTQEKVNEMFIKDIYAKVEEL